MEVVDLLIDKDRKDYKCYDELKRLIMNNIEFRNILIQGIMEGKISGFNSELWQKIINQNIRRIDNFDDVFRDGANIGYCTVASKQLSYSLNSPYICGGILPILKNTKNCNEGEHTWILHDGKIIDTTLMLIIDEEYSRKIGYIEENRIDPTIDPIYNAAREFCLDESIRNHRHM